MRCINACDKSGNHRYTFRTLEFFLCNHCSDHYEHIFASMHFHTSSEWLELLEKITGYKEGTLGHLYFSEEIK